LTADNLIQDLEVYCPNKYCDWKQDLRNLPFHLQKCQYKGLKEFSIFEAESCYELCNENLSDSNHVNNFRRISNLKLKEVINQNKMEPLEIDAHQGVDNKMLGEFSLRENKGLNKHSQMGNSNLKMKPLEQYHDLLHCIEECVNEERNLRKISKNLLKIDVLKDKQNYLSKIFSPYQTPKVIRKENLKTEKKKKRRHKGGEFDRGTEHILKKSKLVN